MKVQILNKKKMWKVSAFLLLILCLMSMTVRAECVNLSSYTAISDTSGAHLTPAEISGISLYSAESSGWSYGSQLEGNARQLYQTLANLSNMRGYTAEDTIFVKLQMPYIFKGMTGRIAAENELSKAIHAFIKDYGEYYWLDTFYAWLLSGDDESAKSYSEVQLAVKDYYSGIRGELSAADGELQKAQKAVAAKRSRYEKVKAAHDYVINLITYNTSNPYAEYGHTIIGGLLDKYNHRAVCEGYAKLFKLLCNANGIPCILVTGGSSTDAMGNVVADHMWNYVQMEDGMWYLVDTTWDDSKNAAIDYTYFLAGAQTIGSFGVTVDEDHIPVGRFNDVAEYEPFFLPELARRSYLSAYEMKLPVQQITLHKTSLSLDVGQGQYIVLKSYTPAQANSGLKLNYTSSNQSVVSVNSAGYIMPKKKGTAVITVASSENAAVKATCKVTVRGHSYDQGIITKEATLTSKGEIMYTCIHGCGKSYTAAIPKRKGYVTLNASSIPLQAGKRTAALKITGYDSNDRVVSWSSSNKKVASVNEYTGEIQAKKKGKAVITVTMQSGVAAHCTVTVQKGRVATKKLVAPKKPIALKVGASYQLEGIRRPITATDKLRYTSSKKSVAAVSKNGKIKGKKKGSAVITVTAANGKKVKIKIKVS